MALARRNTDAPGPGVLRRPDRVAGVRHWRLPAELVLWPARARRWLERSARPRAVGYAVALALVALVTTAIGATPVHVTLAHPAPLYLTAVLACGAIYGRGPAVLAAVLSFLAFDWFFVSPVHTLTVANPDEWAALLLFLLAALVTGELTAALRRRADDAYRKEQEARTLHAMGTSLVSAGPLEGAVREAAATLRATLGLSACDVLLPELDDTVDGAGVVGGAPLVAALGTLLSSSDMATAQWVCDEGQAAWRGWSRGTHRLVRLHRRSQAAQAELHRPQRSSPLAPAGLLDAAADDPGPDSTQDAASFLPLQIEGRSVGVLYAAVPAQHGDLRPAETRLLAAAADLLALAVERRRLQRERVRAEVLQRTDDLRARLLSAVSHDLRTPLAAITAAAGSLAQQDVEWDVASRHAFALQIEREAGHLDRLVGNLLDLSRIEAGALRLDRQWHLFQDLVDDTVARLEPALAGHRVESQVPADLPPVALDYVLIQQVLANLLENAARYTPAGSAIRVQARVGEGWLRVQVEDEGPGIPARERERIFRSFYQVSGGPGGVAGPGPTDRRSRGQGLGLAVCAGFVGAHGGRIWVEDAPGGGAAFVFELPVAAPSVRLPAEAPVAAPSATGAMSRSPQVFRPRRRRATAVA